MSAQSIHVVAYSRSTHRYIESHCVHSSHFVLLPVHWHWMFPVFSDYELHPYEHPYISVNGHMSSLPFVIYPGEKLLDQSVSMV